MKKEEDGTGPAAPDKLASAEAGMGMDFTATDAVVKMDVTNHATTIEENTSSYDEEESMNENISMVVRPGEVVGHDNAPGQEESISNHASYSSQVLNLEDKEHVSIGVLSLLFTILLLMAKMTQMRMEP